MDKEVYFPENKFEGEIENGQPNENGIWKNGKLWKGTIYLKD